MRLLLQNVKGLTFLGHTVCVCVFHHSTAAGLLLLAQLVGDISRLLHGRLLWHLRTHTHTHKHPFNGPLSGTTQVGRYQKGNTNLDFTEARDSEWQWLQLGHMQVCTSLQTDNHASTPPLGFLQAGCPSCHPASKH